MLSCRNFILGGEAIHDMSFSLTSTLQLRANSGLVRAGATIFTQSEADATLSAVVPLRGALLFLSCLLIARQILSVLKKGQVPAHVYPRQG